MLKENLIKAVKEAGYGEIEPEISQTNDSSFGDYASNIALKLSSLKNKQSPSETAKLLVARLPKNDTVFTAEIAQNSFINFRITPKFLQTSLRKIIEENKNFGRLDLGKGKKVQVEFISANPTGPLTLGNGRGGFTGDAIANCLEKAGFEVAREYFINDAGNQITNLGLSILDVSGIKIEEREGLYKGEYIVELAEKVKKEIDIENYKMKPYELGQKAAEIVMAEFIKPTLSRLHIQFDKFVSEKNLHSKGEVNKVLDMLKKKGLVQEKEGAFWFKPKKAHDIPGADEDRVLVRSELSGDKGPTYFLADIAYHLNKFERGFDKVIDIWGADHAGYVPRMKASMSELDFGDKLDIIIVQLVRLTEDGRNVRMSKRTGTFITLEELVNEVGLDVARYFFISRAPNTHLDFDLGLAKEQSEKNPVYYVQYAHARCNSILKKARGEGFSFGKSSEEDFGLLTEESELALIRHLVKLPELVEDIVGNYAVHSLTTYSRELATLFHKFYEKVRVINEDKKLALARLSLVEATKIVLANTLGLMGISAQEEMKN
jgi:arginyl-tRNA synthetase